MMQLWYFVGFGRNRVRVHERPILYYKAYINPNLFCTTEKKHSKSAYVQIRHHDVKTRRGKGADSSGFERVTFSDLGWEGPGQS